MPTHAGVILQARFASTRLPGKALAVIGQRTLIEHCIVRLRAALCAQVVLATTTQPEDDALAAIAARWDVPVFRGAVDDVLGRYVAAAAQFGLDPIIRATGDNPAVDADACGRVLSALRDTGAEFASEEGLPVGAAVEAITSAALVRAARDAVLAKDREHVTTFVKENSHAFKIAVRSAPPALRRPDLRVTVDTREDLENVRVLFARTGVETPTLPQVIAAAESAAERELT